MTWHWVEVWSLISMRQIGGEFFCGNAHRRNAEPESPARRRKMIHKLNRRNVKEWNKSNVEMPSSWVMYLIGLITPCLFTAHVGELEPSGRFSLTWLWLCYDVMGAHFVIYDDLNASVVVLSFVRDVFHFDFVWRSSRNLSLSLFIFPRLNWIVDLVLEAFVRTTRNRSSIYDLSNNIRRADRPSCEITNPRM